MTSLLLHEEEMRHVMQATCVCYMGYRTGDAMQIMPLCFRLSEGGEEVILLLQSQGQTLHALLADNRVCLAFSLLEGDHADSVVLWGQAALHDTDTPGQTQVNVTWERRTGRRFPLPLRCPLW